MEFKNLKVFKSWISSNIKSNCFNFNACVEDFERQIGETGGSCYELSGFETKSGNPEIINFTREDVFFLDGEIVSGENNDFDACKTTITF